MTKEDEARLARIREMAARNDYPMNMEEPRVLLRLHDAAIAERDAAITEGHISAIASKVNAKVAARWDAENCALRAQVEAVRMVLRGESNHTLCKGDAEWSPAYAEAVSLRAQVDALTAAGNALERVAHRRGGGNSEILAWQAALRASASSPRKWCGSTSCARSFNLPPGTAGNNGPCRCPPPPSAAPEKEGG